MSAGAFTHRIHVQTRARNGKVQYPGGRASYTSLLATCAINPNYSILNYVPVLAWCNRPLGVCPPIIDPCLPLDRSILDGQFSTPTTGCILDGGFSDSNYTAILDGRFSCVPFQPIYDGRTSLTNNYNIVDGGSSTSNVSTILDAGNSSSVC